MNKLIIELGGKERTLRFNALMVKQLEEAHTLSQNMQDEDLKGFVGTAQFIYAALKSDSLMTGRLMDLSFADCYDLAEELMLKTPEIVQQIFEVYNGSTAYTLIEEIKKKTAEMSEQTGTQSDATPLENSA